MHDNKSKYVAVPMDKDLGLRVVLRLRARLV